MGRDPVNVTRLLRDNQRVADAQTYAKHIVTGGQVASWHERQLQRDNAPMRVPSGQTAVRRAGSSWSTVEMSDELTGMRATALKERRERLQQLLTGERLMHEAELQAMGLAIDKYAY
mmetsp:Transcript_15708/g.43947  ORF Transcript_15708/g.43947 Transcript_15708/m.43947 type:complete len:117 (+) Transcript_15708:122-472(+)|eukprot:CAMPEP_0117670078 /NCGR_PEP_ID=MMETSP0804-20121206/12526_1 /TAXON_ID=1074897 /ORGANISM="Tetraselmis astigmatica, Strain CCMP880" /LENGTH=116 /DNA_ID=CAMNT_0005478283 /DNA_START=70 /DNA_END=420 /DNA_ORIENTATION=+